MEMLVLAIKLFSLFVKKIGILFDSVAPVAVNGAGQGMLCEQNVPFVSSQVPSLCGSCPVAPVSWTGWRGGSPITPLYSPQQKYSIEPGALKCNELRKDMDFFFFMPVRVFISPYI